jgi:hypothetical protein
LKTISKARCDMMTIQIYRSKRCLCLNDERNGRAGKERPAEGVPVA